MTTHDTGTEPGKMTAEVDCHPEDSGQAGMSYAARACAGRTTVVHLSWGITRGVLLVAWGASRLGRATHE